MDLRTTCREFQPAAQLTSPAAGSVFAGPAVTFTWDAAPGAVGYNFRLGTTPGADNVLASGRITATSITASHPANQRRNHLRATG